MKTLLLSALLLFTSIAHSAVLTISEIADPSTSATVINNGQTTVDVSTGLEWLNFSNLTNGTNELMTMGYSINSSVATYGSYGFRMASEIEISDLFDLVFPTFNGSASGTMSIPEGAGTSDIIQDRNSWLFAFGTDADPADTNTTFGTAPSGGTSFTITAGSLSSRGMYVDQYGDVQYAGVLLNVDTTTTKIYGPSFQTGLGLDADSAYGNLGVFMVRDYSVVPVPAAVWLFASGLLGLVAVARRKT